MPPKRSLQDVLGKIPPSPAPKMSKPRATAKPKATPKVPAIITTAPPNTALASAAAPLTTEVDYDFHIVDRKHYPPVLSNTRVSEYLSGARIKPIDALLSTLPSPPIPPSRSVLYWFRTDLRLEDNTALHQASTFSAANSIPLIALYVFSPSDFDAHLTSPARIDFILRNLSVLRENLSRLNIPLWIEAVDERAEIPARVLQLAQDWGAAHIWANMEYEVDELRRDTKVVLNGRGLGMAVNIVHDTCVVPPGLLTAKSSGKAFAVYSPFYKAFLVRLGEEPGLLTLHPAPGPNPESARKDYARLFGCPLPATPATKLLTPKEAAVQLQLFPAGEQEVHRRLTTFLDEKAAAYSTDRNFPGKPGTAMLSAYLAAGALSARTAVVRAQQKNGGKLKGGREGLDVWISEVAWRDFYRHILVANPHICMHKPFKPAFASITWVSAPLSESRFQAWISGQTGFPIVDAAMRQLAVQKFMPNRLRMVVASFLAKDLHVDWRRGEKYFMEQLVDGDFASNSGGWGFASGAGVDPQPYFRVFNPLSQGEKWDETGEYVRTWVAELKGVRGKEVHCPSKETRGANGYPEECVVHDVQRKGAVEMYKEGVERGKGVV